jgi:hypothetical protein
MAKQRTVCSLTELECKALAQVLYDLDGEACFEEDGDGAMLRTFRRASRLIADGARDSEDDPEESDGDA